jgi:outer membrane protein OmpA-like peptidoglycan-associated protein
MNGKLLTASALACALAACASNPRDNSVLENARSAVQSAEADPNVSQYASLDLSRAKDELQAAEAAASKHKEDETAQHAYLATQNAKIAQLHGQAKADDARVANGQAERDRIQLQARTREASQAQAAAAQANQQRDQIQAEMEQLKATQTQRGMMMTLGDVLFDTGKAQLKSGAARKFDQLAEFLKQHSGRRVQIDGFTDSVGSDSYNEQLSEQRAEAVKNELTSRGIDEKRIGTRGYGKAFPVASNGAPSGRQLNRRVEVVIGNADDAPIAPRSAAP